MDERPSGWYDDPDEPTQLRYWDGTSWTERTHHKAPMPAPQPPKPPVARLRPVRESAHADQRVDSPTSEARTSPVADAAEAASDSPRPWSTAVPRAEATQRRDSGRHRPGMVDTRRPAGFGRRAAAMLLDLLIVGMVFMLLLLVAIPFLDGVATLQQSWGQTVITAMQEGRPLPEPPAAILAISTITTLIFAGMLVTYETVMLVLFKATVGGLATGIRVRGVAPASAGDKVTPGAAAEGVRPADVGGGRLLWRSLIKYAGFVLAGWPATVFLGFALAVVNLTWPLADRRRLALHDLWSGTQVVVP